MKKHIIGFSLALWTCAALAQAQKDYKVTFTSQNAKVSKVYLYSEESKTALDSAVCTNGAATMTGKTQMPQIASLTGDKEGKNKFTFFILDDTPTSIALDAHQETSVSGSDLNAKFSTALDEIRDKQLQMNAVEQEAQKVAKEHNGNIPDSIMENRQKRYDAASGEMVKKVKKVLEDNSTNIIPVPLLAFYNSVIGMDYVEKYMETYAYKNNAMLKSTRDYFAGLKRKAVGTMFTDFTMDDVDGKSRKLSDYVGKGNYVLVDFWASWCGPCRAEMPNVKKAYDQFHPKGFEIVGISLDNKKEAWQQGITQLGITWPQMSDLKGWKNAAADLYGVRSIPATILFDPDGKVVAIDLRADALQKKLEEVYK